MHLDGYREVGNNDKFATSLQKLEAAKDGKRFLRLLEEWLPGAYLKLAERPWDGFQNKKGTLRIAESLLFVVWGGIEPPTHGFSVHCSTNWATAPSFWGAFFKSRAKIYALFVLTKSIAPFFKRPGTKPADRCWKVRKRGIWKAVFLTIFAAHSQHSEFQTTPCSHIYSTRNSP